MAGAMARPNGFPRATQAAALARQGNRCASCGTAIAQLGNAGRAQHEFGESADAHHIVHVKFGGSADLENCVVLCSSCHYSAHEGGNYRFGTVVGRPEDYPFFSGDASRSPP
jgi:5-methylcytosine-specific restriction endonuclease McrA